MKLIALHGYTMNGAVVRAQLDALQRALPSLELVAPDAPLGCAADAVDRLYAVWDAPRSPPPHCAWFDATDDGREYRGWETSRDLLRTVLAAGPAGVIGFSQGAIVAAALAALASHGEMPPIQFAILVAGRPPRADVLKPFLTEPIAVPSLHVWGETDLLAGDAPRALADLFLPASREVSTWSGQHSIPTTGPAADAIVDFIARPGR